MSKQFRQEEPVEIYQPRKVQTEREKLRDLPFKKKITYLWDYYRLVALVVVVVLAVLIYFINGILHPSIKPSFYAAIINSEVNPEVMTKYSSDFSSYLSLDPKKTSIELNTNFNFPINAAVVPDMQAALNTYLAVGEIDVIIAPESEFKNYVTNGYISKLSDELPTDVYSSLTDYFFVSSTTDDPVKNGYGIYLNDSDLFKNITFNSERYILGIVVNYKHEDATIDFIRFLFKNLNKN